MVYQLKKSTNKSFLNSSGEAEGKTDHNVYLRVSTWKKLDAIAESENKSRNQVIRDILRIELEGRKVNQDGMQ
jgi:hypothetical protein